MSQISQTYERATAEAHLLKKQLVAQKLSHENTLKQLQNAYSIIDDMKDMMKSEQSMVNKFKSEVLDKNAKIVQLSHQYEDQIEQIKNMIDAKDEQLRKLTAIAMITDYDVIRLKIVNQLQTVHREQIEALNNQIHKRSIQVTELKKNNQLILRKYDYLNTQMSKIQQKSQQNKEQRQEKHIQEINNLYESLQKQSIQNKQQIKKYELLNQQYQQSVIHYQNQISKLQSDMSIQKYPVNSNSKTMAMQQQIIDLKHQIQKKQDQIVQLERQVQIVKRQKNEQIRKRNQATRKQELLIDEIDNLKKEMISKQNQYQKQMNRLKNKYEQIIEQIKKDNIDNGKINKNSFDLIQLQNENKQLKLKINEMSNINQLQKKKGSLQTDLKLHELQKILEQKNNQIKRFQKTVNQNKLAIGQQQRQKTKSFAQINQEANTKQKLQMANRKIVELLRQKAKLKQQLNEKRSG